MLRITVTNDRQNEQITHMAGPIEFGRAEGEGVRRIVVEDRYVSRNQLRLLEQPGGRVRIINLGGAFTLDEGSIETESPVDKDAELTLSTPISLTVGYTTIRVECEQVSPPEDSALQSISKPLRSESDASWQKPLASLGETPSPDVLTHWFETLLSVQKSAAGSAEFYDETARAVVDLVGLDRGLVLLRDDAGSWQPKATFTRDARFGSKFSTSVLRRVMAEQRTFFESPEGPISGSLIKVESVVASPIFDGEEQIIGVVYGSRDNQSATGRKGIQPLEAQIVQLLAGAVSAGLARVDKEAEAARMRVQFEQFSSPELARELESNPNLLDGAQREITVLFSDIRGFSRMSERLGPAQTYELVGDVMDALTEQVMNHGGVIIDYYGDGLAAMWNAPTERTRHATEACEAALAMRAQLPALNERWGGILEKPLDIGAGVHTGSALVGNAGSRRRLKYGPRGHTVNLAARIEGATKHFGLPILISGSTYEQLDLPFATRRLCKIRVVGIREAVEVHQLHAAVADDAWETMATAYEEALEQFERKEFDAAGRTIGQLDASSDHAATLLGKRIAQQNAGEDGEFDPAMRLDSK